MAKQPAVEHASSWRRSRTLRDARLAALMRKYFDNPEHWIAAALFATGFALVFRSWLFTGFDGAFGDDEDGYLALALI